jgi:hypothetical protein
MASCCFCLISHARIAVYIKNEYRKPIIIKIADYEVAVLTSDNPKKNKYFIEFDDFNDLKKVANNIKIKAKGDAFWHTGIGKEMLKGEGRQAIQIIILDTISFTNYEYKTTILKQ